VLRLGERQIGVTPAIQCSASPQKHSYRMLSHDVRRFSIRSIYTPFSCNGEDALSGLTRALALHLTADAADSLTQV
jgi:hypothetical protein